MNVHTAEKPRDVAPPAAKTLVAEHDPQIMPQIELDISLGRLVEEAQVDADYFANLMADKGVSDADIAATKMVISADTIQEGRRDTGKATTEYGSHNALARTVRVNIGSVASFMHYMEKQPDTRWAVQEGTMDKTGSIIASEAAVHELSHRIDTALAIDDHEEWLAYHDGIVPEKFFGKFVRKMLRKSRNPENHELADRLRRIEVGRAALKSMDHEQYAGAPEEQRAEQLSDEESQKFDESGKYPIAITFKKPLP